MYASPVFTCRFEFVPQLQKFSLVDCVAFGVNNRKAQHLCKPEGYKIYYRLRRRRENAVEHDHTVMCEQDHKVIRG
jgi:hypothetical protein